MTKRPATGGPFLLLKASFVRLADTPLPQGEDSVPSTQVRGEIKHRPLRLCFAKPASILSKGGGSVCLNKKRKGTGLATSQEKAPPKQVRRR